MPGYYEARAHLLPKIVSAIQRLVGQCRNAGIPIIYVQSVRTFKEAEFTVFGREPHLELGSWGAEIVQELKPQNGDTIVQKFSHDPFFKPELDQALQRLGLDPTRCQAIVTGGGLAVCVYHAVLGFYLRDYWTVVPVDCVYYKPGGQKRKVFEQFSLPAYPSIFLSRSDLIEVSQVPDASRPTLVPGS